VLRGVLVDLRNAWGMSTRQLAFRLGVRQQTMAAFLDPEVDQGTRLETVSAICGALNLSISELFELHPNYGSQSSDRRWQMLRNSISAKALDEFVETAMLAAQVGTIDKLISNQLEMVRAIAEAQGIDVSGVKAEAKRIAKS
jgi:DNA-binding Xre family transcriptional regulator